MPRPPPAVTQQPTITLSAPVDGIGSGNVVLLPQGPLNYGLLFSHNPTYPQGSGLATLTISGGTGACTFDWLLQANAFGGSYAGWGAVGVYATIRTTLTTPSPVRGRLALAWFYSGTAGVCTTEVDVDANGTIDATTLHQSSPPWRSAFEIPLVIDSARDIDFVFDCASYTIASQTTQSHSAQFVLQATWHPDQPAVQEHEVTGATADLLFTHTPNNHLDLDIRSTTGSPWWPGIPLPGMVVVGLQPTNVQVYPTLTQLVTADLLLAGSQFSVPLPNLPPGWELYTQGIGFDHTGAWLGTRSLRLAWP